MSYSINQLHSKIVVATSKNSQSILPLPDFDFFRWISLYLLFSWRHLVWMRSSAAMCPSCCICLLTDSHTLMTTAQHLQDQNFYSIYKTATFSVPQKVILQIEHSWSDISKHKLSMLHSTERQCMTTVIAWMHININDPDSVNKVIVHLFSTLFFSDVELPMRW